MTHEQKTFEDYCKRNDISIIKRTDGKYHMRTTRAVYAMWQEAYRNGQNGRDLRNAA